MKEKHKILYTINKYLLGGFFLAYYRPKFENKHLVPKDGPIILCGNHVHLFRSEESSVGKECRSRW